VKQDKWIFHNYQDHVTKTCSKIRVCCKNKDSGCQRTRLNIETCLRNLNLNRNSITDIGMVSICDLLRTNSLLTHLILTRNRIGNDKV